MTKYLPGKDADDTDEKKREHESKWLSHRSIILSLRTGIEVESSTISLQHRHELPISEQVDTHVTKANHSKLNQKWHAASTTTFRNSKDIPSESIVRDRSRSSMNLITLLLLTAVGMLIFGCAKLAQLLFGVRVEQAAAVLGVVAVILLVLQYRSARKGGFPRCFSNRCGSEDYKWLGFAKALGLADYGSAFECKCGDRYVERGNEFLRVGNGGKLEKYKVRRHVLGRWHDPH